MPQENKDNIFYLSQKCNSLSVTDALEHITSLEANGVKIHSTWKTIPSKDNIVVFKGVVSQNYAKWEHSRNNYKYDQKGWDFTDYNHNPIIAWQHDYSYGGIWHAVNFWLDEEGNLNSTFYVDLDALEPRHANQIKNGYVSGVSTGAQTVEYMFEENDTGDRLSEDEAVEKYWDWNVFKALVGWSTEFITLVITKAKLMENSMVTIGSNEKAIASQNSIGDTFKDIAQEFKMKHNISDEMLQNDPNTVPLLSNKTSMTTQVKKNDEAPVEGAEVTTPATTETPETPATVEGDATTTETNGVKTEVNEIEALKNTIEEMKKNHESAIQTLKDEYTAKLEAETNSIRETERANLAKVVAEQNGAAPAGDVKTINDFKSKHGTK